MPGAAEGGAEGDRGVRRWKVGPLDCSLPGSSVHGIFQARVLEWGAIAFSVIIHTSYLSLAPPPTNSQAIINLSVAIDESAFSRTFEFYMESYAFFNGILKATELF